MEFVLKSILFDLSTILFEKSTSSFPEYVRPLKKEVTSPNFLYSHPCFIVPPYRYCYSSAPRRGNFSTGQRPGYDVIMSYSPCKGSFNISLFFIVALAGRNRLYTFYPRRCPGLWKPLGFQPVFWIPLAYNNMDVIKYLAQNGILFLQLVFGLRK